MTEILVSIVGAIAMTTPDVARAIVAAVRAADAEAASPSVPVWAPGDSFIGAIKRYRLENGTSLVDSKNAVEAARSAWFAQVEAAAADAMTRQRLTEILGEAKAAADASAAAFKAELVADGYRDPFAEANVPSTTLSGFREGESRADGSDIPQFGCGCDACETARRSY